MAGEPAISRLSAEPDPAAPVVTRCGCWTGWFFLLFQPFKMLCTLGFGSDALTVMSAANAYWLEPRGSAFREVPFHFNST
jgi:hypothetical protein